MEILILWLALSLVVAFIANARGHDCGNYFIISLLLSPIVGFIIAVAVPSKAK